MSICSLNTARSRYRRIALRRQGLDSRDFYVPPEVAQPEVSRTPPEEPAHWLTILLAATVVAVIVALLISSRPANAQAVLRPVPDAKFSPLLADRPLVSVFGKRFPVLRSGQILVQRHLYLAAVDVEYKQPAWVAFRVQRSDWDTGNVLSRNFNTPKPLRPYCLEPADFAASGYELGHLYGLQFVSADPHAAEVNQLCAIAVQRPGLNKGPWLQAENRIRKLSEDQPVTVLAGQLWLTKMPPLPKADEPHQVASHCWILFSSGTEAEEGYLFPQTVAQGDDLPGFAITPEDLKEMISIDWTAAPEDKP
jgi:endonuclease G, mitochondrial